MAVSLELVDLQMAHNKWITHGRKVARAWGDKYEVTDFAVPMSIIKEQFLQHLRETEENALLALYGQWANPVTIASDLWHWFGRDALDSLGKRGYVRVPNELLEKHGANMFAGAKDLLLERPKRNSHREHIEIALETMLSKRERTARLHDNAAKGLARLDEEISELQSWL